MTALVTRARLLGAGVVLALAGALVAFAPGLVAGFSVTTTVVAVVGVAAFVLAYAVYRSAREDRGRADATAPETADVELRHTGPRPGASFDRSVGRARAGTSIGARSTVRNRLREAAAATLVSAEGYAPEEADAALDAGDWTDDVHAAAFLASDPPAPPRRLRVREMLGRASVFDVRFRHALDEIERLADPEEVPR